MGNNSHVVVFVPLSIMMVLATLDGFIREASAVGECGKMPIRMAFASLSPCLGAARDAQAKVPPACCAKVSMLIQIDPRCLCTVLLSAAAKEARIIPAAAISIPKRCNIRSARSECGIPSAAKGGDFAVPLRKGGCFRCLPKKLTPSKRDEDP